MSRSCRETGRSRAAQAETEPSSHEEIEAVLTARVRQGVPPPFIRLTPPFLPLQPGRLIKHMEGLPHSLFVETKPSPLAASIHCT